MTVSLTGSSRRLNTLLAALTFSTFLLQAQSQQEILIDSQCSISICKPVGTDQSQTVTFDFALPDSTPTKRWREKGVLRTVWRTNSIDYTQTVLLSPMVLSNSTNSAWVLVVDVQGINTDSEYREAFAGLTMRPVGKSPAELELRQGFIWAFDESSKIRVGALEIPESGIRVARGQQLRFYGSMPPSIKGSFTFKLPLFSSINEDTAERLQEMEFQTLLRHASKEPYSAEESKIRLLFLEEKKRPANRKSADPQS